MQLSRFHLFLAFLALFVLRFAVGFHFYKEGVTKLEDGNFDASGFLAGAKGPFAPHFKSMLEDYSGQDRFELKINDTGNGVSSADSIEFDPTRTFLIWSDFIDQADQFYKLGDQTLIEKLKTNRLTWKKLITEKRASGEPTFELEVQRAEAKAKIEKVRSQKTRALTILEDSKSQFRNWFTANKDELIAHFATAEREQGFVRDGEDRALAALNVEGLRYQVDSIKSDRSKKLWAWKKEVGGIWDAYEEQIISLAVPEQTANGKPKLIKPFDEPLSAIHWINAVIPWFDTIVGGLLILGLFTRLASSAAALFLISVVLTQPPWIPGTNPTYYVAIEAAACLVLFATCAGRFGGLDFFLSHWSSPADASE